jgi:hypothetical protein
MFQAAREARRASQELRTLMHACMHAYVRGAANGPVQTR